VDRERGRKKGKKKRVNFLSNPGNTFKIVGKKMRYFPEWWWYIFF
jgi:hypothetical protein